MIDEKRIIERIKWLELEVIKVSEVKISMQGGIIELKKLLEDKKKERRKLCF